MTIPETAVLEMQTQSGKPRMAEHLQIQTDGPGVPTVCLITSIPSPYQVELFDEIARKGDIQLQIIYLYYNDREHPWQSPSIAHEYCVLDASPSSWRNAWGWCQSADLIVFNYYTHPFPFLAMRYRAIQELPWIFWGERPGARSYGEFTGWIRRRLLRPLANNDIPIWGVGEFALEGYRKDWGEEHRYVNFPYFSNLERFARQQPQREQGTFVILYSGLLNRRKNVLGLAREFIACVKDHPEARLWLLGSGPLEGDLREMLQPVADKVRWLGFQPWSELPAIYAQADLLCHPSHYDGWALVVVEALASGLPVIATRSTGAACEFIKDDVNGWLVPTRDGEALQKCLRRALSLSLDALAKMSAAAKASMAEHSLSIGAERFIGAVREALATSPPVVSRPKPAPPLHNPLPGIQVVLASNYTPDNLYSMERYAKLLEKGLIERGVSCTVFKPSIIVGNLPWMPKQILKYLRYIDKYLIFPLTLRWKLSRMPKSSISLVHITDQGNSVYANFVRDYPVIVTCHDLIAAKASLKQKTAKAPRQKRSWFQNLNFKAFQQAHTVVCDSEKTLDDCRGYFDPVMPSPALSRVYISLDPDFMVETTKAEDPELPTSFLLHVGNSSQYKNRPGLFRIYASLRKIAPDAPPLIVMGEALLKEESLLIQELNLESSVHHFTNPSDEKILHAYQHAEALIFPSLEEGFGWPILEAMASGCPVFTSNRAPMTEVGGDAAVYFDPEDIEGAATLIANKLAQGSAWRERQVFAGKERIKSFSYNTFLDSMIQTYYSTAKCLNLADSESVAN